MREKPTCTGQRREFTTENPSFLSISPSQNHSSSSQPKANPKTKQKPVLCLAKNRELAKPHTTIATYKTKYQEVRKEERSSKETRKTDGAWTAIAATRTVNDHQGPSQANKDQEGKKGPTRTSKELHHHHSHHHCHSIPNPTKKGSPPFFPPPLFLPNPNPTM